MKQTLSILFMAGAVLVLIGAVTYISKWAYSPYVYTAGAILSAIPQFLNGYEGTNPTIKRLRKQQVFGAVLLLLTSLFMFTTHGNEWIACLTIAAVLELYTAFRIPQEEAKEK
ncbi:MAG: hypothetical protein RR319_07815 [Bacteroides sp.]